ncbi:NAD(P)H-dependent oxidoreductase [Microbacterium murale]|uniref:NAD(P)H dehydrogenase (Quinone) n=1 Tax=Microbacterium murale TaxID=1081040 RepID=A0ABU0P6J4_9MICO|nr:NAD(P)H-dependent oxidoreductase [Microbacterium murale]MDQ0642951.1 NAD(P)H dehydrogenase (quinone) [Microbacterium murale]
MSSLVVVSHADRTSLTHNAARAAFDAIQAAGGEVEFADLAAENFDPRFTAADLDLYRGKGGVPDEIVAEQERVDRADHLILVFPMYWWSMPALLKGWIDRVFVGGWAYDAAPGAAQFGMLDRLTIHLVIVAGDDAESFERHSIPQAVSTQIERGIVTYSGATHGSTTYIYESDTKHRDLLAAEVRELSERIAVRTVGRTGAGVLA